MKYLLTVLIIIMQVKLAYADKPNLHTFTSAIQTHLDAISERDLDTLKNTLAPHGDMMLILPGQETSYDAESFVKYHENWFKEPGWTLENKILKTRIGATLGIAIVEAMYREADRNGKPYFNRLSVSYTLEKIGERWYIIKDHASSVERTE